MLSVHVDVLQKPNKPISLKIKNVLKNHCIVPFWCKVHGVVVCRGNKKGKKNITTCYSPDKQP